MKKFVIVIVFLVVLPLTVYAQEPLLLWSFEGGSAIWSVATTTHGEHTTIGSWDHNIYSLDSSGKLLWKFTTGDSVWSVASSKGGEYIAAGSGDKYIYHLDSGGNILWKYLTRDTVWSVDISADGEYVVAGSYDKNVYIIQGGESIKNVKRYTTGDKVLSVASSAQGEYFAAGSWDHNIYFFDGKGSQPLWKFETGGLVSSVAISDDGHIVAAGSQDSFLYAFNSDADLIAEFRLGGNVLDVDTSPTGEYIVAGAKDGTISIFHLAHGPKESHNLSSLIGRFQTTGEVWSVAISDDGSKVVGASLDNNIYVLNSTGSLLGKFATGAGSTSVAISSDGKRAVAGSLDNKMYFLNIGVPPAFETPPIETLPPAPPNLSISRTLTESKLKVGDLATVHIQIKNIGGSDAIRINMADEPPKGLEIVDGENMLTGELSPEETINITYTLKALDTEENTSYELSLLKVTYEDAEGTIYQSLIAPLSLFIKAIEPEMPSEVETPSIEVSKTDAPSELKTIPANVSSQSSEEVSKTDAPSELKTIPANVSSQSSEEVSKTEEVERPKKATLLEKIEGTMPLENLRIIIVSATLLAILLVAKAIVSWRRSRPTCRRETVTLLEHLGGEIQSNQVADKRNIDEKIRRPPGPFRGTGDVYRKKNIDILRQLKENVGE